jgi:hypothetical protein
MSIRCGLFQILVCLVVLPSDRTHQLSKMCVSTRYMEVVCLAVHPSDRTHQLSKICVSTRYMVKGKCALGPFLSILVIKCPTQMVMC